MAKVVEPSDIVHVVHPSPVSHVPKGSRVPRRAFERLVTPARLARMADGDLVGAPDAARGMGLLPEAAHYGTYVVDGALWVPLRLRNNGRGPTTAVDPQEFRGLLEMSRPDVGNRLAGLMRWTPVVACWQSPTLVDPHHMALGRGIEMTPRQLGRVVSEERERSILNMVDYLARNVIQTATRVLVRMVSCARSQGDLPDSALVPTTGGEEACFPPCRHDLLPEAKRAWSGQRALPEFDMAPLAFGERFCDDGDVLAGANVLSRKVDALLERLPEEGGWKEGFGPAELREVRERYATWCMRGRIGAIGHDDVEAFLVEFTLLPDNLAEVVKPGPLVEGLARHVRFVERVYLPRFRSVGSVTDEDLSILEGIVA